MSIDTVEKGAIAKIDGRLPANPKSFSAYLNNPGRQNAISQTAASFMDTNRLIKILLRCVAMNPELQRCTMDSVFRSALMAAELGLELGSALGEAYLVPYKEQCQMIPGYRGLIALARRSGQVDDVYARAVFAGDEFEVALGTEEHIKHVPKFGPREPIQMTYVYAVAKMAGGGHHFDIMTRDEVEAIRMRSATGKYNKGPWGTDYIEMAKKTVVRRMVKMLPLSVEMAKAVALDTAVETGDFSDIQFDCIDGEEVLAIEGRPIVDAGTGEISGGAKGSEALKQTLRANGNGAPAQPTAQQMADAEFARRQEAAAGEASSAPAMTANQAKDIFSQRARGAGYKGPISQLVCKCLGFVPTSWGMDTWQEALAATDETLHAAISAIDGPAETTEAPPDDAPAKTAAPDEDFDWEDPDGAAATGPRSVPGAFQR